MTLPAIPPFAMELQLAAHWQTAYISRLTKRNEAVMGNQTHTAIAVVSATSAADNIYEKLSARERNRHDIKHPCIRVRTGVYRWCMMLGNHCIGIVPKPRIAVGTRRTKHLCDHGSTTFAPAHKSRSERPWLRSRSGSSRIIRVTSATYMMRR